MLSPLRFVAETPANLVNKPSRSALVARPLQDQSVENSRYQREDSNVFPCVEDVLQESSTFIPKKSVITVPIVSRIDTIIEIDNLSLRLLFDMGER